MPDAKENTASQYTGKPLYSNVPIMYHSKILHNYNPWQKRWDTKQVLPSRLLQSR